MRLRNDTQHWGSISIALHWLTLALILGLAAVGLIMSELPPSEFRRSLYALHKSIGLSVLALTLLRLIWRLWAGTPKPVPGTPRWQTWAANGTQGALYLVLLAMPLSGWLFNSAAGYPLMWFDLFAVPKLSGYDPAVKAFAIEMHETLFYALVILASVHATAALVHHYRNGDATLKRMWPWIDTPPRN